ncbi:MAG: DsrE family protein [Gammaproteobacteria bacterium]|jgi:intracellular sulfur oxidation DsrE/DsrF family protein
MIRPALLLSVLWLMPLAAMGQPPATARIVEPDYAAPKVVYDFYFDDPRKIDAALYWIRSLMNPLTAAPYGMAPEMMDIVVVIHGTEIVTLARKNYPKYHDAVERMRYYHQLGVRFRVCALAAADYGYRPEDFQDFVEIAPSAFAELVYWQQQGYALITPRILDKHFSVEEIR